MTRLTGHLLRGAAAVATTAAFVTSIATGAFAVSSTGNDNLAFAEPITALPLVTLDSAESFIDTAIADFDDPSLREPYACNDANGGSLQAAVTFTAVAGVKYLVQVGVDGQVGHGPVADRPVRVVLARSARSTSAWSRR